MIDPEIFKILRTKAINALPEKLRGESFGYHIDVVNDWESSLNTYELLSYLGIHNTHKAKFSELCFHLDPLNEDEIRQVKFHRDILHAAARLIYTATDGLPPFKYDCMELVTDWRYIKQHAKKTEKIVDFGAGCCRQAIAAFANLPGGKPLHYVAIDASLNGYTIQNAVLGCLSTIARDKAKFYDLLDFESSDLAFPPYAEGKDENITFTHMPAWTDYSYLPDRSMDVIIASHVHNEISRPDFDRLMHLVTNKLADDGIFYVRSELGIWHDYLYFEAIRFHCVDMVKFLDENGIDLVDSVYFGGFQTSIFRRHNGGASKPATSQPSSMPAASQKICDAYYQKTRKPLAEIKTFRDATFFAAHRFAIDETRRVLEKYQKIDALIEGTFEFDRFIVEFAKADDRMQVYSNREEFIAKICKDKNPCVISSAKFFEIENSIKEKQVTYGTRTQYTYPVIFLIPGSFDFDEEKGVITQGE